MDVAEFAPVNVMGRGNHLVASHGGDEGLIVEFYNEAVYMGAKSEEAGRPIYEDKPFIWIRFPGDRTREVKRRVDLKGKNGAPPDNHRFPRQWAAYQSQEQYVEEGTPLEQWGPMSKSMAMTYRGAHIYTVENLSAVTDDKLQGLGHGARDMRDKAIAWLKSSSDGAESMRLAAENKRKDDRIDDLERQIAELASRLDDKSTGKKAK